MNMPVAIFSPSFDVEGIVAAWRQAGATVRRHLTVEEEPWDLEDSDLILAAAIESSEDAELVVAACARGVGLLGQLNLEDSAINNAFLRDLHRLGPVYRVDLSQLFVGLPLTPDELQVLKALASGTSVGDAATSLFISKRTAERRVASARKALGVRTTAEGVTMVAGLPQDELAVFGEFRPLDPSHTDLQPDRRGMSHG